MRRVAAVNRMPGWGLGHSPSVWVPPWRVVRVGLMPIAKVLARGLRQHRGQVRSQPVNTFAERGSAGNKRTLLAGHTMAVATSASPAIPGRVRAAAATAPTSPTSPPRASVGATESDLWHGAPSCWPARPRWPTAQIHLLVRSPDSPTVREPDPLTGLVTGAAVFTENPSEDAVSRWIDHLADTVSGLDGSNSYIRPLVEPYVRSAAEGLKSVVESGAFKFISRSLSVYSLVQNYNVLDNPASTPLDRAHAWPGRRLHRRPHSGWCVSASWLGQLQGPLCAGRFARRSAASAAA